MWYEYLTAEIHIVNATLQLICTMTDDGDYELHGARPPNDISEVFAFFFGEYGAYLFIGRRSDLQHEVTTMH